MGPENNTIHHKIALIASGFERVSLMDMESQQKPFALDFQYSPTLRLKLKVVSIPPLIEPLPGKQFPQSTW